jgi:HAD superfamily hydrolase (TIGR01509 family)
VFFKTTDLTFLKKLLGEVEILLSYFSQSFYNLETYSYVLYNYENLYLSAIKILYRIRKECKMKAVVFDMDGLMIDTEGMYFEAEREMARMYGRVVKDETLWKMMGRKPLESMQIYVQDLNLNVKPEDVLKLRDDITLKKLNQEVVPMPGLYEILNSLKGKIKLAIATGSPDKFLKIVIDKLRLEDYFDVMQASDSIINGKPEPEIYLKTIDKLGCFPEDCIVLEDSSNGALAGKRAGCYTIAIPSEYTNMQDFSFVDYAASNLSDAADYIMKNLL